MSLREVAHFNEAINRRNHYWFKNKAAIQGVDIPDFGGSAKTEEADEELSPEQKAAMDEALEKAKLRKIKELRRG